MSESRVKQPTTRVGADIGGTFTDVAYVDPSGRLRIGKRLTTHGSEGDAILDALAGAEAPLQGDRVILAHGHTLVINSLLERKGAKVALVTTEGFKDVLDIGRGSRPETFNLRYRRNPVLIPVEQRFEVAERVHADGHVQLVPDADELASLVETLKENGTEAVAIAFLNSYLQPSNEEVVRDYLRDAMPGVAITLSSDMSREWRELERFTTAAANAYVAPVAERYTNQLIQDLNDRGFKGEFIVLDSNGGALSVETAKRYPVRSVESGPVAGVLAARNLAEQLSIEKVVTFDMGGTTAKSCLIENGRFASTDLYWIGGYDRGFALQVQSVDVTEVGAGGGSIAWMDEAGRFLVGPRSAGSQPGPACFGRGGTEPTVTDANCYCGRLDKDNFVGAFTLDVEASRRAIDGLADKLGMDGERLALGILKLANVSMARSVRRQTLERGRDPREFALVAYGGAGPMHACEVAAEAGIGRVVIPGHPGHFSALGMLGVNLRLDRVETFRGLLREVDRQRLADLIDQIADELEGELVADLPDDHEEVLTCEYLLALRYHGQDHSLLVPAPKSGREVEPEFSASFRERFEEEYLQRYGHLDPQSEIEIVGLQVIVLRNIDSPTIETQPSTTGEVTEIASIYGMGGESVSSQVVPRASLEPGTHFEGPMVIYEEGSTTVVPPKVKGEVFAGGELVLDTLALADPASGGEDR